MFCKYKLLFVFFLFGSMVWGQKTPDFHNYFYDQRRSFFESMPNTKNEIILLGDSLTNCANWEEIFPGLNVKNRGISGDTTFGVLDRMDEVTSSKPKKVFILIGINDISQGVTKETILKNYFEIISKIQKDSPKTQIFVQSLLPTNDAFTQFKNHQGKMDKIVEVNKELKVLAQIKNTTYVDLFSEFLDEQGKMNVKYTNDGLHLLGSGYQLWAGILTKMGIRLIE